jgi:hypothetical protein
MYEKLEITHLGNMCTPVEDTYPLPFPLIPVERDGSVWKVTGYGLDDRSSILGKCRAFVFTTT